MFYAIHKLSKIKIIHHLQYKFLFRNLYTRFEREISGVTPFCSLHISVPYNVVLEPLDLYKYPNCDKIIIKIDSSKKVEPYIKYEHVFQTLKLSDKDDTSKGICRIEAPIKANIIATSLEGNITVKNFNGQKIFINTGKGNINTSKLYCEQISMTSLTGNITCRTVLQATDIMLKTGENGNISTDKVQGTNLSVETLNGSIDTMSSYCNNSNFTTEKGCLNLHKVHKSCRIICKDTAKLKLACFDGTLQVSMDSGEANIQIARIEADSTIEMKKEGLLTLKLSNDCVESSIFRLLARDLVIKDDIAASVNKDDNFEIIKNDTSTTNTLVHCPNSSVIVENLSFKEMFNLKDFHK